MRIGFVTDEISANVEEALNIGVSWGIRDFELRMMGEHRVPAVDAGDIRRVIALRQRHGLRITALSPGVFKGTLQDEARLTSELHDTLPETFHLARVFDTKTIIIFGFQRSAGDTADHEWKAVEVLRRAAWSAQEYGMTLAVENEPGFWCDTGANTARVLAQVNSAALCANWDPANALGTEPEPFPEGYNALKKWIANVHVKDAVQGTSAEYVAVGEGNVDWRGQLQALVRDKAVEQVTIETHCLPLLENSQKNLKAVRGILAAVSLT